MSFHIEIGLTLFPSFMFVFRFKVSEREREKERVRERETTTAGVAYILRAREGRRGQGVQSGFRAAC